MKLVAAISLLTFLHHLSMEAGLPYAALSTNNATVRKIIVSVHNAFRAKVFPNATNMLRMRYSREAARSASRWAKACNVTRSTPEDRAIPYFNCGENIFMQSFKASWPYVIETFFKEGEDFIYGKGAKADNPMTRRYVQVVSYNTHLVGCAYAECRGTETFYMYVCRYCPEAANVLSSTTPYRSGNSCDDCPRRCDGTLCTNPCMFQDFAENCTEHITLCKSDKSFQERCRATCTCRNNEIK
ncbi:cysteine-rich venom protein-like [Discoglossus pictus]